MKWPWTTRRRLAEARARAAEAALDKTRRDRVDTQALAEQARRTLRANGFTEAIRQAMGVNK